jgi:prepilin-type processing-associated H-X9-DG protein
VALFWVGLPGDEFGDDAGQRTLYELDAKTGTKRQIALEGGGMGHIEVISNSAKSIAALVHVMEVPDRPATVGEGRQLPKDPPVFVQFYLPGANLGPMVQLPENAYPNGWNKSGTALSIAILDWNDAGRRTTRYMLMDSSTGKLFPAAKDDVGFHWLDDAPSMQGDEVLTLLPLFEEGDPSEKMRPVYLVPTSTSSNSSSSKPLIGALVSAEAEYAELSPLHDGVLYVTRGVAMYRPILELSKSEFEKGLKAASRAESMNRAKQVALALIMYATDYDDQLPSNAAGWQDLVEPYCKNKEFFEGFQYTFAGGDMTKVEYPAATEMGFIPVDGGRIVAYLDGHVEFRPDRVAAHSGFAEVARLARAFSSSVTHAAAEARGSPTFRQFRQARGP